MSCESKHTVNWPILTLDMYVQNTNTSRISSIMHSYMLRVTCGAAKTNKAEHQQTREKNINIYIYIYIPWVMLLGIPALTRQAKSYAWGYNMI